MKKQQISQKLLSVLCCLAMIVALVPILPAAAADGDILFTENFDSYSAGAEVPAGGKFKVTDVYKRGVVGCTVEKKDNSQYVKLTANEMANGAGYARIYLDTADKFSGSYTVSYRIMIPEGPAYLTGVKLPECKLSNGTTVPEVRMNEDGVVYFNIAGNAVAGKDTATRAYLYSDGTTGGVPAQFDKDTWYRFELAVNDEEDSVTARMYTDNGILVAYRTLTGCQLDETVVRFDHFSEKKLTESNTTVACIDDIKVVSGAAATGEGSSSGNTTGEKISSEEKPAATASSSSFTDAAEITYNEEVAITAGLGLFAGADGKFMPKDTVTRAQMAAIIIKMLYGADANANSFKGMSGGFTDTANFEGGWAEGYVQWCTSLGIVKGYGDGTFRPGNPVTAAEAVTMILNALKIDAGEGTWPVTVMAKAEEVKFFEDLNTKPASDKALSREELAVVSLAGLLYSPEGKTGYLYDGKVFDSYFDALLVAGDASKITPAANDTLATKVYELKTMEGFITGNQDTGLEYTELNGETPFAIESGLDSIGHYVTVYYKEPYESDEEPGVSYAIFDETLVVKVDEDIDTAKEYKNAFGKTYNKNADITLFDGEYNKQEGTGSIAGYDGGQTAPAGTYFIYKGNVVSYMDPATVYASQVTNIINSKDKGSITLSGVVGRISNTEDDDGIVEYEGVALDDYVTYTMVQGVYHLTKAEKVTGTITSTSKDDLGRDVITVNGGRYISIGTENNNTGLDVAASDITFSVSYDLYVTGDGKYIGFETTQRGMDMDSTVYLLGVVSMKETNSYGKSVYKFYARGIDMSGKEVMILVGVQEGENAYGDVSKLLPEHKQYKWSGTASASTYVPLTQGFFKVDDVDGSYPEYRKCKEYGIKTLEAYKVYADFDEDEDGAFYAPVLFATTSLKGTIRTADVLLGDTFEEGGKTRLIFAGDEYSTHIVMEGELNDSTPIQTKIIKKKNPNLAFENGNAYMLLSPNLDGSYYMQACVVPQDLDSVGSGSGVFYVSAEKEKPAGQSADGYTYDVYDAATGVVESIVIDNEGEVIPSGFYSADYDSDYGTYELRPRMAHASADDGVIDYTVYYGQVMAAQTAGKLYTCTGSSTDYTISNTTVTKAKVVDVRSEDTLENSIIPEITSMDQIINLRKTNPNYTVYMDICEDDSSADSSSHSITTIFVTGTYVSADERLTAEEAADLPENVTIWDQRDSFSACDEITTVEQLKQAFANEDLIITAKYSGSDALDILVIIESITTLVMVMDDFESYTIGDSLTTALAQPQGWEKTSSTSDKAVIDGDSGNQYLSIVNSRPYIYTGTPSGSFTLEFDLLRQSDVNGGTLDLHLMTVDTSAGKYRLRIHDSEYGSGVGVFQLNGTKNQTAWMITDGSFRNGTSGALNGSTDIVKLDKNIWYHFTVAVDMESQMFTLSVKDRDNAGGISYTSSYVEESTVKWTNLDMYFDWNSVTSSSVNCLDNVKLTLVP